MQAFQFGTAMLAAAGLLAVSLRANAGEAPTGPQSVAERLDWVPVDALSSARREALAPACCGAFVDSSRTPADVAEEATASGQTRFTAEEGFTRNQDDSIHVSGEVSIAENGRSIVNDGETLIDTAADTFALEGDIEFREPGVLLRGNSAFIDNRNNRSELLAARYVLHESGIHGSAATMVYDSESGRITLDDGEFSRCEPVDPFWTIAARAITLEPAQGQGNARDLRLRFGETTVFRYPFALRFPLGDQRVSGLLPPSMGSTRSGGFDFEQPYYLNLAPHYDATLAPRLISDRGLMLGGEFRYLADWSMNQLNLSWLGGDDLFDAERAAVPGSQSPPVENRWFASYQHNGRIGEHWRTLVDFTAVSDRDWFVDLAGGGLDLVTRNHLNRQARLSYTSDLVRAEIDLQRIQLIDPLLDALNTAKPYDRLPHFRLQSGFELGANFRFEVETQAARFERKLDPRLLSDRDIANGALQTGRRVNFSPRLEWALERPGAFLRATAHYEHARYALEQQALGTSANPSLGMAGYSLDGGLIFERGLGDGNGRQTLEPRLFYLYRQFRDQSHLPVFDSAELNFGFPQLFRERRFSGGDRFADADQIGLAVSSRLLDGEGREQARFSLGQVRYFRDRLVSLADPLRQWQPLYSPLSDTSALVAEAEFRLGANWRVGADAQWNEHYRALDEGSLQLRYQRDSERLFNFAWRYRSLLQATPFMLRAGIDPGINQTDISGAWPLSTRWKLLARWNYDHANSRNLEAFAGVEYRNCCTTIRVLARDWLDEYELFVPNVPSNRGVFVQISLHGIGNLAGGGLSDLLRDGIQGFRDSDYE